MSNTIGLLEAQLKAMIQEVGLVEVSIALHNALIHGTILPQPVNNNELSDLFDTLDALIKIAKKIG